MSHLVAVNGTKSSGTGQDMSLMYVYYIIIAGNFFPVLHREYNDVYYHW